MTTAEQKRLKTANNNGSTTTAAQHPNKHIEAIANKTSQEFVQVAADLTRQKIREKLSDGTFTSLVFGGCETEENFTYSLPFGSSVNVLSGATEV